jgi:transcriptional regulator with XRE-family HTH domain
MTSLRHVRAERLLSIRELARQASVAPSTLYLIEAGRTMPRPRVVRCLAAVLGVEPNEVDEFRRAIEAVERPARRGRGGPSPHAELAQPPASPREGQ